MQSHHENFDVYNPSQRTPKTKSRGMLTSTPREYDNQRANSSHTSSFSFHGSNTHPKHVSHDGKKYILPLDEQMPGYNINSVESYNLKHSKNKSEKYNGSNSRDQTSSENELPERVMALSLELEFVQKERIKIMSAMTVLKGKLTEIENLLEESQRELAMEQAFINAELKSKTEKVQNQKDKLFNLQERADKCQQEIEDWQENRNRQQKIFNMSAEKAEIELFLLKGDLENCKDEAAQTELQEKVYQQVDVVDSQKKLYEDLEFKFLEEESVWLAKKEELNRDISDAVNKYEEYVSQVCQLESWINPLNEPNIGQLENFREQRVAYLQRLEEVG